MVLNYARVGLSVSVCVCVCRGDYIDVNVLNIEHAESILKSIYATRALQLISLLALSRAAKLGMWVEWQAVR